MILDNCFRVHLTAASTVICRWQVNQITNFDLVCEYSYDFFPYLTNSVYVYSYFIVICFVDLLSIVYMLCTVDDLEIYSLSLIGDNITSIGLKLFNINL